MDKNLLVITVTSAGGKGPPNAQILVNDEPVAVSAKEFGKYRKPQSNSAHRGLHLAVINPENGFVEIAAVYDTSESSLAFDNFIDSDIPEGYIVAAACNDDFTAEISEGGLGWFESMGSRVAREVRYKRGFAFVGVFGRNEVSEKMALKQEETV